jgi:hypothetical protein
LVARVADGSLRGARVIAPARGTFRPKMRANLRRRSMLRSGLTGSSPGGFSSLAAL